MPSSHRPGIPTVLQGAYACDLAPDANGRAFAAWAGTDWAEEALFVARSNTAGGGWQFGLGRDERDFMARLGAARYRVYAGELGEEDLAPIELAESHTVIQDPAVAVVRQIVASWPGASAVPTTLSFEPGLAPRSRPWRPRRPR